MIKIIWISESLGICFLGITMEDTLLKVIVFLCGLISLILSITFAGLLKHLQKHNETFSDFRTKTECVTMHESTIKVFEAQLETVNKSIENLTLYIKNGGTEEDTG